jgi:hypothetical protein
MTAFDKMAAGLNEAIAYARGEETGAKIRHIAVPPEGMTKRTRPPPSVRLGTGVAGDD